MPENKGSEMIGIRLSSHELETMDAMRRGQQITPTRAQTARFFVLQALGLDTTREQEKATRKPRKKKA